MRSPKNEPIIREIVIPTNEQKYELWELMGVYTQLMELSGKMTAHPAASLPECEQFTRNVKAVLNPQGE